METKTPKPRYLTKSRFKSALECPTKLYYTGKADYANQSLEDSFLAALADGGFQVGELAKLYFPGGQDITSLDYDLALEQTNALLKQDNAIIYEAAIRADNLFIRADILKRHGLRLELIEVKAKSFNTEESSFFTKAGTIKAEWAEYLYDVAFQKHVIQRAFPGFQVRASLMLADKNAVCPTDGLNQKFRITRDAAGRKRVSVSPGLTSEDLATRMLCRIDVDAVCDHICETPVTVIGAPVSFSAWVEHLARRYQDDCKIPPVLGALCRDCEFIAKEHDKAAGKKSGFHECWTERLGWGEEDFQRSTVLDLWNYRRKDHLIKQGCFRLADVEEEDIKPKTDERPGLSASKRQWLQVRKEQDSDNDLWLDKDGLQRELASWRFPLHFIDFETTMVAIPFNKGRRPYEGIAFQFSHHIVDKNGEIAHAHEYLNTTPGEFPNYHFIRQLMHTLQEDDGSIFRYSAHENTFLNTIYRQLLADPSHISDRQELLTFIQSITRSTSNSNEEWEGGRAMIDLLELVKRYYFDPATKGSNSLKYVLPSVINRSAKLQEKYSQPIYGAARGIRSLNYADWRWVQYQDGKVIDPYRLLPKMFTDVDEHTLDILTESDELREGGAAMTAYGRMQFEEMSDYEREEIRKALLKYCELDTMAMVMLYEGWGDLMSS